MLLQQHGHEEAHQLGIELGTAPLRLRRGGQHVTPVGVRDGLTGPEVGAVDGQAGDELAQHLLEVVTREVAIVAVGLADALEAGR